MTGKLWSNKGAPSVTTPTKTHDVSEPLRHAAHHRVKQRKKQQEEQLRSDKKNKKCNLKQGEITIGDTSESDMSRSSGFGDRSQSSSLSLLWRRYSGDIGAMYKNDPSKVASALFLRKLILYVGLHFHYYVWYIFYINSVSNIIVWLSVLTIYFTSFNYWYRYPFCAAYHRRIDQIGVVFSLITRHVLMNQSYIDYNYWYTFTLYDSIGIFGYICGMVYGPSYFSACCHLNLHFWAHYANVQMGYAYNPSLINIS